MAISRREYARRLFNELPALQRIFTRRIYKRQPHWQKNHPLQVVIVGAGPQTCTTFSAPLPSDPDDVWGQFSHDVPYEHLTLVSRSPERNPYPPTQGEPKP